jgi:hypothetical protein
VGIYIFIASFLGLTMDRLGGRAPEIINGEYVLNSHGKIVGHISERDYLLLKGWEVRLFASGWILFCYALMMHWWFPRQDEWTVVMPD